MRIPGGPLPSTQGYPSSGPRPTPQATAQTEGPTKALAGLQGGEMGWERRAGAMGAQASCGKVCTRAVQSRGHMGNPGL